jgi:hypothetical protein
MRGRSSSPGRVKNTASGVHPTSYPMGTGTLSPGGKRPGCEVDHSPTATAEVKKMWIYKYIGVMDLYIHSPIRPHGVVFNWLITGTTLPVPYTMRTCVGVEN